MVGCSVSISFAIDFSCTVVIVDVEVFGRSAERRGTGGG